MGTGELNGVYYPVGKAICEIVNQDLSIYGVRCSPETTPGSVYNTRAIQSGELDFGIVQADVNFNAYKGEGAWIGKPFLDLRSVLSLYPELVTVVRDGDAVLMPSGYHPNVSVPGHRIAFLWAMAAHREVEDRQFGVVNIQPGFDQAGSGLDKGRK